MSSPDNYQVRRTSPSSLSSLPPPQRSSFVFTSSRYPSSVFYDADGGGNDRDSQLERGRPYHKHSRHAYLSAHALRQHAIGATDARSPSTPVPNGFVQLASSTHDSSPSTLPDPVPSIDRPLWIPYFPSYQCPIPPTPSVASMSSISVEPDSYFPRVPQTAESGTSADSCCSPPSPSISVVSTLSSTHTVGRPVRHELSLTELFTPGNDMFGRPRAILNVRDDCPRVKQQRPRHKPVKSGKKHNSSFFRKCSTQTVEEDVIAELKKARGVALTHPGDVEDVPQQLCSIDNHVPT
ncbi:hypothetical protein K488DRAFT_82849 [Vararia minispora EC-137]|uniref:Uncharacterized protein n=1 Tax=Vararia minispora EC-137 TaxID=1314806 RepID=A0ACB8QVT9_9AGAM|nr:hypothetical protein K488DRAFT_82849 [Vararia minispora EC-137]